MAAEEPHVVLEVRDNCAWLILNRPEQKNCVTNEMVDLLYTHLSAIAVRNDVDVVVLTARGSSFCPGADLTAKPEGVPTLPPLEHYQLATLLTQMPQVTVAAINGACAGPGLAWASACDLRIAAANARFSTAFVRVGLVSEFGLIWTLQRNLGTARAKELMLLGDKCDAQTALAIGLVSRVFASEEFADACRAFVEDLASRPPAALRAIKEDFIAVATMSMREYVEYESVRHQANFFGGNAQATRAALADRSQKLRSQI